MSKYLLIFPIFPLCLFYVCVLLVPLPLHILPEGLTHWKLHGFESLLLFGIVSIMHLLKYEGDLLFPCIGILKHTQFEQRHEQQLIKSNAHSSPSGLQHFMTTLIIRPHNLVKNFYLVHYCVLNLYFKTTCNIKKKNTLMVPRVILKLRDHCIYKKNPRLFQLNLST